MSAIYICRYLTVSLLNKKLFWYAMCTMRWLTMQWRCLKSNIRSVCSVTWRVRCIFGRPNAAIQHYPADIGRRLFSNGFTCQVTLK
jgi:hypothetical protein